MHTQTVLVSLILVAIGYDMRMPSRISRSSVSSPQAFWLTMDGTPCCPERRCGRPRRCLTCKWEANTVAWLHSFPWLTVHWVGAVETLTRKACVQANVRIPRWATCTGAQACHFQEHEKTSAHTTAVGGVAPLGAPSVSDFASVLRSLLNGQAPGQGMGGVG